MLHLKAHRAAGGRGHRGEEVLKSRRLLVPHVGPRDETMAGKASAALQGPRCSLVCPSILFLSPSVCPPPQNPFLLPTHTHAHTNALAQLWNEAARQPGRAVKTITGCRREVIQEDLSFNLQNASRHKADDKARLREISDFWVQWL